MDGRRGCDYFGNFETRGDRVDQLVLPIPCLLPTVHRRLPIARCPLPTAHCLLPAVRCLLPAVRCLLPAAKQFDTGDDMSSMQCTMKLHTEEPNCVAAWLRDCSVPPPST
jgi:hypothetical protein